MKRRAFASFPTSLQPSFTKGFGCSSFLPLASLLPALRLLPDPLFSYHFCNWIPFWSHTFCPAWVPTLLCASSLLLPSPSFLTASLGSPYAFIFPRWINVGNCYGENSTVNYEFSRSFRCSVQLVSLMQSALALPLHCKSSSLNAKAGFIS